MTDTIVTGALAVGMPVFADRGRGEPISLAALLAAGKKVNPDVTQLLEMDHREAMALFDWYDGAIAPDVKAEVAHRLCTALTVHMRVEEEILYPAARDATGDDALIDHSIAEHSEAKELVARIQAGGGDRNALVSRLRRVIAQHVEDEEETLFPELRHSDLDLYACGCRLAARRGDLLFDLTGKEFTVADAPLHMDSPQVAIAPGTALPLFADGLRNAHALEKNCREMLERQVDRLEKYPAIEARLRDHIKDKDAQLQRIEGILDDMGESPSMLKDAAAALTGTLSSLATAPLSDEVLRNNAATYAMANLEIATYESLMVLGEAAGKVEAVRALQSSLSEERAMANWLSEHVRETAVMFLKMREAGSQASH